MTKKMMVTRPTSSISSTNFEIENEIFDVPFSN